MGYLDEQRKEREEEWNKTRDEIAQAVKDVWGSAPSFAVFKDGIYDEWVYTIPEIGTFTIKMTKTLSGSSLRKEYILSFNGLPGIWWVKCEDISIGAKEVGELMMLDHTIKNACTMAKLNPVIWHPKSHLDMMFCTRALTFGKWTVIVERHDAGLWTGLLFYDWHENAPKAQQKIVWSARSVDNIDNLLSCASQVLFDKMTIEAARAVLHSREMLGRIGVSSDEADQNAIIAADAIAAHEADPGEPQDGKEV